jgi:iron complex transport system permease protein
MLWFVMRPVMADIAASPSIAGGSKLRWLLVALVTIALPAMLHGWSAMLSPREWLQAIVERGGNDIHGIIFFYNLLPRFVATLICGAALALSGSALQAILRNPIAEPTTLGSAAGASLALTIASLQAPWLMSWGRDWVALAGAAVATGSTFALTWRRSLSPLSVVLVGLVISLGCSAFGNIFALLHRERLQSIFIWGTGSLAQNDWSTVLHLLPRIAIAGAVLLTLARPLAVMSLGDGSARNLGLSLNSLRFIILITAVALGAFVVSAVGMIGFVGLAAPALTRFSGVRPWRDQLIWSPVIGAMLLWTADQLAQSLGRSPASLPAGTVTAILGAFLLLWLAPKSRITTPSAVTRSRSGGGKIWHRPLPAFACLVILFVIALWIAVDFAHGARGWRFDNHDDLVELWRWRWPRILAALSCGGMLGAAGVLIQRLTSNPMASPEILGISWGSVLGVVLLFLSGVLPDHTGQIVAATLGAVVTLVALLASGRRHAFSPEKLLLTGIAIGTAANAITTLLMASGDPRLQLLINWMSGSTYQVSASGAVVSLAIALLMLTVTPLTGRWLEIMPLGDTLSRSLGINLLRSRGVVLLVLSILTATATLIAGPFTFVGLMGPHLASFFGLRKSLQQTFGAAIIGALIMVLADWLGRNLLFPYQIPAGLLASFIGGPLLLWLMWRNE